MTGAHYERLGVRPNASETEIRAAYRRLARRHHPDAQGGRPSPEMAAINEAWSVLSDPGRRAMYDAALRGAVESENNSDTPYMPEPRLNPLARYTDPPRFPWRLILVLVALASAAILIVGALTSPSEPTPIDNLVQVGSCVVIDEARQEAVEADCSGEHDAVVEKLVPFDGLCPLGLVAYRDRQGMGLVCVVGE